MVSPPELRYAMNGEWRIAYEVLGDGPDLIYVPGWVSNVEGNWLAPDHARFIEGLASFARAIVWIDGVWAARIGIPREIRAPSRRASRTCVSSHGPPTAPVPRCSAFKKGGSTR